MFHRIDINRAILEALQEDERMQKEAKEEKQESAERKMEEKTEAISVKFKPPFYYNDFFQQNFDKRIKIKEKIKYQADDTSVNEAVLEVPTKDVKKIIAKLMNAEFIVEVNGELAEYGKALNECSRISIREEKSLDLEEEIDVRIILDNVLSDNGLRWIWIPNKYFAEIITKLDQHEYISEINRKPTSASIAAKALHSQKGVLEGQREQVDDEKNSKAIGFFNADLEIKPIVQRRRTGLFDSVKQEELITILGDLEEKFMNILDQIYPPVTISSSDDAEFIRMQRRNWLQKFNACQKEMSPTLQTILDELSKEANKPSIAALAQR
jgi:hypothetical protein